MMCRKTSIFKYTSNAYNFNVLFIYPLPCYFLLQLSSGKQNYIIIKSKMFFKSKLLFSVTVHVCISPKYQIGIINSLNIY